MVEGQLKAFKYADLDGSERLLSYFYWVDPTVVRDLFVDDIQAKINPLPMSFLLAELDSQSTKDPLERMLYLERRYFLVDHNFNYTDKMSMATGVKFAFRFWTSGWPI